jgi:hypothetical protein
MSPHAIARARKKCFLIRREGALPLRWNGRDPLRGFPDADSFLAEARRWVQDGPAPGGAPLLLSNGTVRIEALRWPGRIHPDAIPGSLSFLLPKAPASAEPGMGKPLLAGVFLLILLGASLSTLDGSHNTATTPDPLIPAKYARILLSTPSGGSVQSGRARPATGGRRAFQTRSVQTGMRALLKTSLSSVALVSPGKAIRNLSESLTRLERGDALSIASRRIAGTAQTGATRMGSDSGYGSLQRPEIAGQGKGRGLPGGGSVGLDTREASVDQGLTREEVARVIHSHMNEIRYCYESGILRDPTLAGKLLVDFRINPLGEVPAAAISESSLADEGVRRCLLGKLRGWRFPQPRGGVQVAVSYPFIFKSLTR